MHSVTNAAVETKITRVCAFFRFPSSQLYEIYRELRRIMRCRTGTMGRVEISDVDRANVPEKESIAMRRAYL